MKTQGVGYTHTLRFCFNIIVAPEGLGYNRAYE